MIIIMKSKSSYEEINYIIKLTALFSSRFNQNFGMNGILDFIHGTNSAYRKTIQYSRQKVLLSIAYDEQNVAQNIAQNAATTKES